ncbi:MAG: TIGR03013 family PEP-CTERM/XrtA system glycosyltransferase [Chromatiales bacterium]|nr:TIGR03013 family PEP-CTERM/XrtA system glycosyltransferase [Chromatiales bacterium]
MVRLFGHYIPRAFLLLAFGEWLAAAVSIYLGIALRFPTEEAEALFGAPNVAWSAVVFAGINVVALAAMGLYQRGLTQGHVGMLARVLVALAFSAAGMSLAFYLFPALFIGRGAFAMALVCDFALLLGTRAVFFAAFGDRTRQRRVLVLGAGKNAARIQSALEPRRLRGFQIVGFVRCEDGPIRVGDDRLIDLETGAPLLDFALRQQVDEIVVALDERRRGLDVHGLLDCKLAGIEVVDLIRFFERELNLLPIRLLTPGWLVFSETFRSSSLGEAGKRLVDLLASAALLLVALPVGAVAALAIWIEDRSAPVLFRQTRVGRDGRHFQVVKFRSMRTDAEADGVARFADEDDPRVTRVGRLMRKTRVDELPQIWNVLRGDMSFVGPRPERPEFVEAFAKTIPFYNERHRVKPGISGWAQLCYQYGSSADDAEAKLEYDLYYVKNASLFLDLIIILRTVEVVLWGKGGR